MLLHALSTGQKLGLGLTAAAWVVFSLVVSLLVPRRWPQFPGRWLPAFLAVTVVFFFGMLAAVEIFGKGSGEAAAGESPHKTTTTAASTGTAHTVAVRELEFKILLPKTSLSPGTYTFDVSNAGKIQHDLTITGPGGKKATPTISPGSSGKVTANLQKGTYDFYCSIPGHKAAGMDVKVTVS